MPKENASARFQWDIEIKGKFKDLLLSGQVKGHIGGPSGNVLICDDLESWAIASGEMAKAGFQTVSPGGFGGTTNSQRDLTSKRIWRDGKICAVVIEKRVLIFTLPQGLNDYCNVVVKKEVK